MQFGVSAGKPRIGEVLARELNNIKRNERQANSYHGSLTITSGINGNGRSPNSGEQFSCHTFDGQDQKEYKCRRYPQIDKEAKILPPQRALAQIINVHDR